MWSIVQWFGWWGYLIILVVGVLVGILIAANNPTIAKWISDKVSNAVDKGRDKLEDIKK